MGMPGTAFSANSRNTIHSFAAVRYRAIEVTMQPENSALISSGRFRRMLLFTQVIVAVLFLCVMGRPARGQMQTVSIINTVAGNGTAGFSGDGGQAINASFNFPRAPGFDSAGNLYICDYNNNRVRKVAPNGIITTVAGNGTRASAGDGGPATSAELNQPSGTAVDNAGNIYIAETGAQRIRRVDGATGIIMTVAGTGVAGYSGDGGIATAAMLSNPQNPNFDSAGNLYFADYDNNRIRKVTISTGIITTVAGNGAATTTGNGGPATAASLNGPVSVVFDVAGNLYISERNGNVVRRVAAAAGIISTFAGNGTAGFSGDGGPATSAEFNQTYGLAFDAAGDVLISDVLNQRIRMVSITTGIVTTIAGNGTAGFSGDGGAATSAELNQPIELATNSAGQLFVADALNNRIREFTLSNFNFPTTNVGSSSATRTIQIETSAAETINSITVPKSEVGAQEYSIGTITGCTVGASSPADTVCNVPITFMPAYPGQRWVPLEVVTSTGSINFGLTGIGSGPLAVLNPGVISTAAGTGTQGYAGDGGPATGAELSGLQSVTPDYGGNLYIADGANQRIRKLTAGTGVITTVVGNGTAGYSGDGGPATSAEINVPEDAALDSTQNLYIADEANNRIRMVSAASGIITTVAGNGTAAYSGDGGPATAASLDHPSGTAVDAAGNLYIADGANQRIRRVAAGTGIITTVAGNGNAGYSGDGGPASSAEVQDPAGMVFDSAGNLYFVDEGNQRVREVSTTGIITTYAGNGTGGYSGDGGPAIDAELNSPTRLAIDSANNLYIADNENNRVRKVDAQTGVIATVAGNGTQGSTGDDGVATNAELSGPVGVGLDGAGDLFVTEHTGNRVRKIDENQSILNYPTPTSVGSSDSADNPQTAALWNIGNASLTIPPAPSGNNPGVSRGFSFDPASTCPQLNVSSSPQTLASGSACTIAIDFAPNSAGAVTGTAVPIDTSLNAAAAMQTIHLNGTGAGAGMSTSTTVVGSPIPSAYLQSVVFTATVASTAGTTVPTGTMQFMIDGTLVGSPVTLTNGTAAYTTTTLAVGSHSVVATYTPATSDGLVGSNGSTSQTVTRATLGQNGLANITLASSPNPSNYLQTVTFTATVPGGLIGSVQFVEGTTVLGTGTIDGATAFISVNSLAIGTDPVTAVYSGDVNFNPATSAVDNQVVMNNLDFTLTLTSAGTQTVIPGNLASYALQVAPTSSNYPGTVTFSATGLPTGATVVFSPNTVATNGGTAPISVSVQTASQNHAINQRRGEAAPFVLALLVFPFAFFRRIRRCGIRALLFLFVLLGGLAATAGLSGCGGYNGNGFFGQNPQNYTITITATSGSIQHSVSVMLNVQ
jgi:sugar lactone lactonase YvrE